MELVVGLNWFATTGPANSYGLLKGRFINGKSKAAQPKAIPNENIPDTIETTDFGIFIGTNKNRI